MKKLLVVALGALVVASTANAQIYVEGNLGYSKLKTTGSDHSNVSGSHFSPSIALGYKMADWRAAVDYTDYGKASSNYVGGKTKIKAKGFGVSAFYDIDLNSLLTPYVGVRLSTNTVTVKDYSASGVNSDSSFKLGYGAVVGATYKLGPSLDLNSGLEYNRLGNWKGIKINQYGLKVGLRYSF